MTGNIIQVKNNVVYDAIKASNDEAEAVVTRWLHDQYPDAEEDLTVDLAGPAEIGMWFVRHPDNKLMLVPAEDFVKDFTEVDIVAEFAAELQDAPTAAVAAEISERIEAQTAMDAFIGEKVGNMMAEFDDLLGMFSDEDDSTGVEGVEAARVRFMQVFGVKEN